MLEIVDWDRVFENAASRKVEALTWIRMPNKHDGDSYIELLSHPRGEAHYGCWGLIVQVASKTKKRGILSRKSGEPHTPETIARAVHAKSEIMREAITRLIEIGWMIDRGDDVLRLVSERPVKSIQKPRQPDSHAQPMPRRGEERRGEEKRKDVPDDLKGAEPEILEWLQYKREKGQTYKPVGLKRLWTSLRKWTIEEVKAAIQHSITCNYAGIFQPKNGNVKPSEEEKIERAFQANCCSEEDLQNMGLPNKIDGTG